MSVLDKIERDRMAGELASLESMLASIPESDFATRLGFEARRETLKEQLAAATGWMEPAASTALFFGGRPVVSSVGIEAEFGGNALAKFQDLVSKVMVQDDLGQRGPVPHKAASALHITNVVRGSFGFLVQEVAPQASLVQSNLSHAVEVASALMIAFSEPEESDFQTAAAEVGSRALATAGEFFAMLKQNEATFRLVSGDRDHSFNSGAIALAAERAMSTRVEEFVESYPGKLSGTLPESHAFEFKLDGRTITGKVDRALPSAQLAEWNLHHLNEDCSAHMRVRRVFRESQLVRETYVLADISFSLIPFSPYGPEDED